MSNRTISKSKRRKQNSSQQSRKQVQREHKDRLFRIIFQNKEDLLDLYNAMNDTDYRDVENLEITTIEDVMYLSMKNDLSFILGVTMNLYEHQSTWNENMPLRGFFYFSELYQRYLNARGIKLTDERRQIFVPFPKYVVFYNGTEEKPDQVEMKLSDSFLKLGRQEEPCLECKATVLNINAGHNRALLQRCRRLGDYAFFISEIRWLVNDGWSLEDAVDFSMNRCIERGILSDVLKKHGTEVCRMILTEYNEKEEREYLRRESWKEGVEEGRAEGHAIGYAEGRTEGYTEGHTESMLSIIQKKHAKGKSLSQIAEELEEEEERLQSLYEWVIKYPDKTAEELAKMMIAAQKEE